MKTLYTRTTGTLIPVCHRVRLDRKNSITRIQFYQTKNRNSNEYAVHGVFSTQGIPIYGKDTLIRVQHVFIESIFPPIPKPGLEYTEKSDSVLWQVYSNHAAEPGKDSHDHAAFEKGSAVNWDRHVMV